MQVSGVMTSFGSRLDSNFKTAATPPTTTQLIQSIDTRPSAEFMRSQSASSLAPKGSGQVDVLA